MTNEPIVIRAEAPADFAEIHTLVKVAFETAKVSNGKEQDFVDDLRKSPVYLPDLALVAEDGGRIVGHVMLTRYTAATGAGPREILLLAPLAVRLEHRGQGLGARLIEVVLAKALAAGHDAVVLVGDPAYYGRFGFRPSVDFGVRNTAGIPAEYVMMRELVPGCLAGVEGTIDF